MSRTAALMASSTIKVSAQAPAATKGARMARSLAYPAIRPSYLIQCRYPPVLDGETLVRVLPVPGASRTS